MVRRTGLAGAAAPPLPGGGRGYLREVPPPGQVLNVGGVLGDEPPGLGLDLVQVRIPGNRRVLRVVVVLLVRFRRLVPVPLPVQQGLPVLRVVDRIDGAPGLAWAPGGILVRPGVRGGESSGHVPSPFGN